MEPISHLKTTPCQTKKPMTLWPFLFVHSVVYNIPRGTFPLLGFLTVGLIDVRGRKRKAARSTAFRSPSEGVQEPNANFYTLIISEMPNRGFSMERMENFPSVRGLQIDCMYVRVDVYVIWGLNSHLSSCSIRGTLHHHDWCQLWWTFSMCFRVNVHLVSLVIPLVF